MSKRLIFLSIFLITVCISCNENHKSSGNKINSVSLDLNGIRKRGKLIAITDFNPSNYFAYKGEPVGFNYELLKSFSDHIGIDLEIVAVNHLDDAFRMLGSGEADLLALGLTDNSQRTKDIRFTEPIDETRQVLVQRKPYNWRLLSADATNRLLIRNHRGLAKKSIYVEKGTSHCECLAAIAREIRDSINIIEVPYEEGKLIQNVSGGEIDYTVCDENIALVNATYYPEIDVSTPVSFPQNVAWGLRKNNSDSLLLELNRWITEYKKTGSYALLHDRYFNNSGSGIFRSQPLNTRKFSKYDDLIREYSAVIKWDWRLLAALICQESRFNPNVRSLAGAYGLMQIMPQTGKNFGIDITASPINNLKAGIKYITWLYSIFNPRIQNEDERLRFILASYNAGPGHILDAMKLAEKNGMNPQKWDGNVALWLKKKSDPQYYNDEVVKFGYFRGIESVAFVSEILDRYEQYKNIIPEKKLK